MQYYAHISDDKVRKQTVKEHLTGTARLSGLFAEAFRCGEWGYGCGILHDIGKYSQGFRKRLEGGSMIDHATAGAQEMMRLYARSNPLAAYCTAYCISGHHSGLLDGGRTGDTAGEATLQGRLKKQLEDYSPYKDEIALPDFPGLPLRQIGRGGFSLSFFIRMLFSCLVDADYQDTEHFMLGHDGGRGGHDDMDVLLSRLESHIGPWLSNDDLATVNGRRTAILKACLQAGSKGQGLYQLTVPTGGGKTVSSLAFALRHAAEHGLSRIIYVIPYTSIIEQNAQVFKEILGRNNVLENHCNVTYEDKDSEKELKLEQMAAENWDKPVVVTTNVRFFESLYACRTSGCRKLHNIANSVIIFDEAQMLPAKYLMPCLRAISELICNYHCTAVICTATQPSLQPFFPPKIQELQAVEICPDVKGQYDFFKRTKIHLAGQISQDHLVSRLEGHQQVLCILNSRKRVQRIYESIQGEGTYHLSTLMYPKHRKVLLREIRNRLLSGEPCRLISTSLVEAGVDFDFPAVYRELAGIDSVIQAAGRCNREGKRDPEECMTQVFTLEEEEDIHIPRELKLPISVAGQIAQKYEDISSPEAIGEYFTRLYRYKGEGLDAKDVVEQFEQGSRSFMFPFASVASGFRLIESNTRTILIDIEPEAVQIAMQIRRGEHSRQLIRQAGQYCVNVYEHDFEALSGAGRLEQIDREFYVLRNKEQYTRERGLVIDVSRGDALMF